MVALPIPFLSGIAGPSLHYPLPAAHHRQLAVAQDDKGLIKPLPVSPCPACPDDCVQCSHVSSSGKSGQHHILV